MVWSINLGPGLQEQFHDVEMFSEGGVGQGAPKRGYRRIHRGSGFYEDLRDLLIAGTDRGAQRFGFAAVLAVDAVGSQEFSHFCDAASLGGAIECVGMGTEFGARRRR